MQHANLCKGTLRPALEPHRSLSKTSASVPHTYIRHMPSSQGVFSVRLFPFSFTDLEPYSFYLLSISLSNYSFQEGVGKEQESIIFLLSTDPHTHLKQILNTFNVNQVQLAHRNCESGCHSRLIPRLSLSLLIFLCVTISSSKMKTPLLNLLSKTEFIPYWLMKKRT